MGDGLCGDIWQQRHALRICALPMGHHGRHAREGVEWTDRAEVERANGLALVKRTLEAAAQLVEATVAEVERGREWQPPWTLDVVEARGLAKALRALDAESLLEEP